MLGDSEGYPVVDPFTPLGQALVDFFDALAPVYSSGEKGVFQVIVFGGCAVHIHTQSRGSADIDAEVASHGLADKSEVIGILSGEPYSFFDEEGVSQLLEFDTSFNTTLAPLHEDYVDRVTRLKTQSSSPFIEVFVASPIDVAISKLGRFAENDQADIQALLKLPLVDVLEFERLAKEAIDYYVGEKSRVQGSLKIALEDYYEV